MRRLLFAATVTVVFSLSTGGALALTGSPITVATEGSSGPPSVAVEPDGTALVAWADTTSSPNVVHWCALPAGGGACAQGGELQPADSAEDVDGVSVLDEGTSLVILADVYAASDENGNFAPDYESVQEWQSAEGGATFAAVDGGKAVASGDPSFDTQPVGAVTLPGDSGLGFGFTTASGAPSFHAFSLTNPTLCGRYAGHCPDGFATLQPATDPDQISNPASRNFAANQTGVIGMFGTNFTSGSLGCSGFESPFGDAIVIGTGAQSASNNYNLSPGTLGSAWASPVEQECNAQFQAVGAGPSGFGILEQLGTETIYEPFVGTPVKGYRELVSSSGETEPAVSQDGAGAVYATFLSGGPQGPVSLAYSPDGGKTWGNGPAPLAANPGAISGLTSDVNATGQGWAAWIAGGSVIAQQFDKTDAQPAAAATSLTTSQITAYGVGTAVTIPQGSTGETDQAEIHSVNAAQASGTMTYTLYSAAGCRAASAALTGGPQAVHGAYAPEAAQVGLVLQPGTYYWQAVYSGDALNLPAVSPCDEALTVTPAATIAPTATSNGQTVTFAAQCAAVPCTVDAALSTTTRTSGSHAVEARHKPTVRIVKLGKGTFKLRKTGRHKLTLKLSKTGRRYLATKHGRVKASIALTERLHGHRVVDSRALTVKVSHPTQTHHHTHARHHHTG